MKTTLTNEELKALGYRINALNTYLFFFINNYDAIIIDNESREVTIPYGTPKYYLEELKIF